MDTQLNILNLSPEEIHASSNPLPQPEKLYSLRAILKADLNHWTKENLSICSTKELQVLCCVIGLPHSLAREESLKRLVTSAGLLFKIRRYDSTPDETASPALILNLANAFSGKELKAFCKAARIFAPPSKYGMAGALIKWRRECRREGIEFLNYTKNNQTKGHRQGSLL